MKPASGSTVNGLWVEHKVTQAKVVKEIQKQIQFSTVLSY